MAVVEEKVTPVPSLFLRSYDTQLFITIKGATTGILCLTSFSENLNENLDTFYESCQEGMATTDVLGLDPAIDLTFKLYTADPVRTQLYKTRYSLGEQRQVALNIKTDKMNENFTTKFIITSISIVRESNKTTEMNMSLRPSGDFFKDVNKARGMIDYLRETTEINNLEAEIKNEKTYEEVA